MRRIFVVLAVALTGTLTGVPSGAPIRTLASPAAAQPLAPVDTAPGVKTCGEFRKLDLAGQVATLKTIEPLGDEIDPTDQDAAKVWAEQVSEACGADDARPLEEAAVAALDQH